MSEILFNHVPLRSLSSSAIRNGAGEKGLDYDPSEIRYVRTTDIAGPRTLKQSAKRSIPRVVGERYRLEVGDLLMTAAGATIGKSYLHEIDTEDCCFAGFLVRAQPKSRLLGRYLSHWSQSSHFYDQVWSGAVISTIPNFSASRYRSLQVPLPATDVDLELIVRYLDHAEMRIAKAIASKNNLLASLLEMRRVRIAAGILGPDTSVRVHSGLPFEVPSSWRIEPFWSVAPEVSISGHPEKELLSVYLDRGVIRYSESGGQVHKPSLDLTSYQLVRPHDLVLNNQQAWRGSVGVSLHEGIISPAYVVCRLDDRFDTEYANLLFRSPVMVSQFELASRGVGSIQRQLHRPSLRILRVPIPPRPEQERIASQLTEETREVDAAVESLRDEIALLKEYRMRLISDVVTGKLDVRAEAANLPDVDPLELAAVLAGGTASTDEEEGADGDD